MELPKILPHTDIWLGGPQVSYDAPGVLRDFPQVKGIMIGEGEATFRELLQWYVDRGEIPVDTIKPALTGPDGICGLCLPSGFTAQRELTDMSALPFLYQAEDGLDSFENRIIYYEQQGLPIPVQLLSVIHRQKGASARHRNREKGASIFLGQACKAGKVCGQDV